jgi:Cu(I)/Ag(I) efflux system membrane fusion protein
MHPQIKLPKPGKCPICFMPLIPLANDAGDEGNPRQLKMSQRAEGLAEIRTSPVRREYATNEIRMVGKVDYDETKVANITAWVPGRLDRLFVDFTGVAVRKGDHLVSMYSPDLVVAQRELIQAWQSYNRLGEASRELTESNLRSTEEKLRLLGVLPEQIEEIKKLGKPTDHLTIYAPSGGIVIDKLANEGMYVQTGTKIYTIVDLSVVWVYLDAYESDVPWLRYGQQVEFTTESYPGEIFKGRVAFIDPMLSSETRTVRVRVNVPNPLGKLKPEMFVRAVVRSQLAAGGKVFDPSLIGMLICPMHPEIVKDGPGKCDVCGMDQGPAKELGYSVPERAPDVPLIIPASAPLVTGKRAVVYVRMPDKEQPTFEGREILLGERAGDYYVVRHGLQEGELVVTNGNFKIDSALQIQARPSMMSPDAGATASGHQHRDGDAAASDSGEDLAGHEIAVSSAFRTLLNPLYNAYLEAAGALADDDLAAARAALERIPPAVTGADTSSLDETGRQHWKQASDAVLFAAYEAREAKDRDRARRHFGDLSSAMTGVMETFGHALPGRVFRIHCPMALDAKGGDWLQLSEEVHNPYYGPAMPECGDRVATYESQAPLDVPDAFRAQLAGLYDAYLQLQTALTDDREADAKAALGKLPTAFSTADARLLQGRALNAWQAAGAELSRAFEGNWQAADMDGIRQRFERVSNTMLAIVDAFGHTAPVTLHRAFCPMAFDKKGAAWLQAGDKLANPYYGQKMLRCGEFQRNFPPTGAMAEDRQKKEGQHEHR